MSLSPCLLKFYVQGCGHCEVVLCVSGWHGQSSCKKCLFRIVCIMDWLFLVRSGLASRKGSIPCCHCSALSVIHVRVNADPSPRMSSPDL